MLIFLKECHWFCYPAVTVILASIPAASSAKVEGTAQLFANLLRSSTYRNHTDPCASKEGAGFC